MPGVEKPSKQGVPLAKKKYDAIRWLKRTKGMPNKDIAEKVGVSESTVYRVVSGKKFRASMQRYRESLGIQQLNNAAVSAEVAAIALKKFLEDPEKIKEMDARAIKDMGTFSNAQLESGLKTLEKEIRAAEDQGDPEFKKAKELIVQRRAAKIVSEIPQATDAEQTPPVDTPPV